jgi:hypothetical protein
LQLEKLRAWLDDALHEYEKSNQVLQDNFQELQRENHKVRAVTQVFPEVRVLMTYFLLLQLQRIQSVPQIPVQQSS